jgi:nitrate reductase NapAB chaperone NapD
MPISGVVISCHPEQVNSAENTIKSIASVEIHHCLENGSLVAVLESASVEDEVKLVKEIMQIEGVVDVRLAYHNFEDLEENSI